MPQHSPLTRDAHDFLAWGCGDRTVRYVPDGRRHMAAVQEVLACGFSAYTPGYGGIHYLTATESGRGYLGVS